MVSKVKSFPFCSWTILIFTIQFCLSCRSKQPDHLQGQIIDSHLIALDLNKLSHDSNELEKEAMALGFEQEWLSIRNKLLNAELDHNLARKALIGLKIDFARFSTLNDKFPDKEGFISEGDKVKWKAKFVSREEGVSNTRAKRNLILREMNELRFRILDAGFSVPVGGVVK